MAFPVVDYVQTFLTFAPHPYRGEAVDCPVCGSADHQRICNWDRSLKRLHTDLCGRCGLFFTNPMPTDDELEHFYSNLYRYAYQFAFFGPRKKHKKKKLREALRRAATIGDVAPPEGAARYLDFGCGSGELVREMASRGYNARGFEPGPQYGEYAREKMESGAVSIGPWKSMTFADEGFDVITCLHVLEHLNDPMAALSRLRSWLAPSGVLYLETPDLQAPAIKGFDCFHFAHVLGFSGDNLAFAAEQAGFGLLRRDGPTSLFLVRDDDLRAQAFEINLPATVAQNRRDYSEPFKLGPYARRHGARLRKMFKTEVSAHLGSPRTTGNGE